MRRAEAEHGACSIEAEPVDQTRDLLAEACARAPTISASAIVPAEIKRSSSADNAAMQI